MLKIVPQDPIKISIQLDGKNLLDRHSSTPKHRTFQIPPNSIPLTKARQLNKRLELINNPLDGKSQDIQRHVKFHE